ncbi:MAG: N-acetylmuramoyl-L-alanine amidase [Bacteroidota bacterium]
MFKRLAEIFSNFFGSIFGGNKTEPTTPTKPPTKENVDTNLVEDSSDVPVDTVMVVDVMDVDIPIADNDPGAFADDDKAGAFDENSDPEPTPEPAPTGDGGSSTTDNDPGTGGDAGSATSDEGSEPTTPPPPTHKQRYLWCLDNGHGKEQAGKRSPIWDEDDGGKMQFFEYEFNRDVVERIIKQLKKNGVAYYDVVPDYLKVGSFLKERVARANKEKSELPKLFVSVHANAGPAATGKWVASSIKGAETWFAHNSRKGKKMAAIFQRHILKKTGFKDRKLKSTKIKNLYVLVKTVMPAILTENGFYNNKSEVKELMKDAVRQKIADAHVAAIMEIEKNGL